METKRRTLKQILNDTKFCASWLITYLKVDIDKDYVKKVIKDIEKVLINCDIETLEEKY